MGIIKNACLHGVDIHPTRTYKCCSLVAGTRTLQVDTIFGYQSHSLKFFEKIEFGFPHIVNSLKFFENFRFGFPATQIF